MAVIQPSPSSAGSNVVVSGLTKTNPEQQNVDLNFADTEVEITLPARCVEFRLKARGLSRLKYSYSAGQSGILYGTIHPGSTHIESRLFVAALKVYVQSNKAGEVVEVTAWTT